MPFVERLREKLRVDLRFAQLVGLWILYMSGSHALYDTLCAQPCFSL
jgi:hypothetical protein